jgi:hypothetical protein
MQDSNDKISMHACIGMEIQMWKHFSFKIESRITIMKLSNILENKNNINPTLSHLGVKSAEEILHK